MLRYASAPDRIARTRVAWNQTMLDLAMARRRLLGYVHERGTHDSPCVLLKSGSAT